MNQVSACCKGTIEIGRRPGEFGGFDIINYCDECGDEVEEIIECCEHCGEPAETFIETKLGGWCETCCELNPEVEVIAAREEVSA